MDLIFWRHAQAFDAEPGGSDFARSLTPKGEGQADRVGQWLDRHLPDGTRVLVSPARRAEQTARALGREFNFCDALAPDSHAEKALALIQSTGESGPRHNDTLLLVGHQPILGQMAARLLGVNESVCHLRKGAVWWLRSREREGTPEVSLLTVISPDLI